MLVLRLLTVIIIVKNLQCLLANDRLPILHEHFDNCVLVLWQFQLLGARAVGGVPVL